MSRPGPAAPAGAPDATSGDAEAGGPVVVVLADDLIWSTRLAGLLAARGAAPIRAASLAAFEAAIAAGAAGRAVIDLTARTYDGVEATRRAALAGLRVLCVAQHDDAALRRAARAAGADKVCAYRTLAEAGAVVLGAWLETPAPAPGPGKTQPAGRREA